MLYTRHLYSVLYLKCWQYLISSSLFLSISRACKLFKASVKFSPCKIRYLTQQELLCTKTSDGHSSSQDKHIKITTVLYDKEINNDHNIYVYTKTTFIKCILCHQTETIYSSKRKHHGGLPDINIAQI